MRKIFLYLTVVFSILLFACNTEETKLTTKEKKVVETNKIVDVEVAENGNATAPYEIKEDGLYVYYDGPYKKEWHADKRTFDYVKKNYKYLKLDSKIDKISDGSIITKWRYCTIEKSGESNLGKPSLYELGYERHREREIKPEDERFGREVIKKVTWKEKEKREYEKVNFRYIDINEFTQISLKEFVNNGIVIIGNKISRVVISKLSHLPKWGNKILVSYEKLRFNCDGEIISNYSLEPQVVGDFKRINLKENIFEFIKEEPLPKTADYLSDLDFIKLSENIHQFIPRNYRDNTIHNKHTFRPGYYLIEYYDGTKLNSYFCVKIGNPGKTPVLTEPLNFGAPTATASHKSGIRKFGVKLGRFSNRADAWDFAQEKAVYPIDIIKTSKGDYIACIRFFNIESAIAEKQNLINAGLPKNSLSIIKLH